MIGLAGPTVRAVLPALQAPRSCPTAAGPGRRPRPRAVARRCACAASARTPTATRSRPLFLPRLIRASKHSCAPAQRRGIRARDAQGLSGPGRRAGSSPSWSPAGSTADWARRLSARRRSCATSCSGSSPTCWPSCRRRGAPAARRRADRVGALADDRPAAARASAPTPPWSRARRRRRALPAAAGGGPGSLGGLFAGIAGPALHPPIPALFTRAGFRQIFLPGLARGASQSVLSERRGAAAWCPRAVAEREQARIVQRDARPLLRRR